MSILLGGRSAVGKHYRGCVLNSAWPYAGAAELNTFPNQQIAGTGCPDDNPPGALRAQNDRNYCISLLQVWTSGFGVVPRL